MPPDPILALLSLVAMFVYVATGSVVAIFHLRFCDWELVDGQWKHNDELGRRSSADWSGPAASVVFWPVLGAWWISVGLLAGVLYGPVWLGRHLLEYIYSATEKS